MTPLEKTVETFIHKLWVQHDTTQIAALMHDDVVLHGLEEAPQHGIDDVLRFHRMICAQFTGFEFRKLHVVEAQDSIAYMGELGVRDLKSGRRATATVHVVMTFTSGRITQVRVLVDYLCFFQQLGRLPERTLDLCLLEHRMEPVRQQA